MSNKSIMHNYVLYAPAQGVHGRTVSLLFPHLAFISLFLFFSYLDKR